MNYLGKVVIKVDLTSRSIRLMGSTISISILNENADFLLDEVFSLLKIYENRLRTNASESRCWKRADLCSS